MASEFYSFLNLPIQYKPVKMYDKYQSNMDV